MTDALLAPFRLYNRTIGQNAYTEVPTLAGLSGLAGYYGGGAISDKFIDTIAGRVGGADPERVERAKQLFKSGLGVTAAALAGWYALGKHLDKRPQEERDADFAKDVANMPLPDWSSPSATRVFDSGRPQKTASSDPFALNVIPVNQTLDTIKADPYLAIDQKQLAGSLVGYSPTDAYNNTSGRSIVRTALKAGVDFGAAYLFGRVMTGLAGLPAADAKQLSVAGGIANALYNTGIFK